MRASGGAGVHFGYNPGQPDRYLRRVSADGVIGSRSLNVSRRPPGGGTGSLGGVAYMNRGYAIVWDEYASPTADPDVYIASAPAHDVVAIGAGPDPAAAPEVRILQPEYASSPPVATIVPYGAGGYGANVGGGDVDGDESDEVLTGPGPGAVYGPQVRVFGWRGAPVPKVNFYAYGTLKYGVLAQAARLDADGPREILTGAGPGVVFGPHVRGFDYDGASLSALAKVSFYAYATLRYGVNVAGGDVEGDGFDEILTGPGPGLVFGSQLRGFDYDGVQVGAMSKLNAFVYAGSTHGLHVAAGDTDEDWVDEIGCGSGPSAASDTRIAIYDYFGISGLAELPGSRFEAFPGTTGGARLAFVQWWDADFHRELVASPGPLPSSGQIVRAYDDAAQTFAPLTGFVPYQAGAYGVTLAACFAGF